MEQLAGARAIQASALKRIRWQAYCKPTVLTMDRHDLGDWQAQSRKYEVGAV